MQTKLLPAASSDRQRLENLLENTTMNFPNTTKRTLMRTACSVMSGCPPILKAGTIAQRT